jgi:tetratricopeptide (TPR) repeat protein
MCTRRLPDGSVAFLRHVGASGTILNHPNDGGFLEWELYPRFRIFTDLQTPFLFSDTLTFIADQAFQDAAVFGSLVDEYHPAFLLVPKVFRGFAALAARYPDYAAVFIDDAAVLYASSAAYPEIVSQYRITAIDPATLQAAGTDKAEAMQHAAAEAARINAIYPGGGRMRVFEGALALERGDLASAMRIADEVTASRPDRWEGHRFRGDVLVRMQRAEDAAQAYEAALSHIDDDARADQTYYLEGRLWSCYTKLGRREDAYQALRKAFGDLYRPAIGHEELASLAGAALDAGHQAEGRTLLEFALAKTPASAPELRRQLEAKLRALPPSR